MVERAGLVEPPHMDGPLDRLVRRRRSQGPRRLPGDRHGAEIDVGRIAPVHGDLRLAGLRRLVEGRLVEERKPDRPLDLVDVETGEKHHGGVRIDPDHRQEDVMGLPVGEEGEHLALIGAAAARRFGRLAFVERPTIASRLFRSAGDAAITRRGADGSGSGRGQQAWSRPIQWRNDLHQVAAPPIAQRAAATRPAPRRSIDDVATPRNAARARP